MKPGDIITVDIKSSGGYVSVRFYKIVSREADVAELQLMSALVTEVGWDKPTWHTGKVAPIIGSNSLRSTLKVLLQPEGILVNQTYLKARIYEAPVQVISFDPLRLGETYHA
jgi:hypothetical protein